MKTLHMIKLESVGQSIIGELVKNHEQPAIKAPLGVVLGQTPDNKTVATLFSITGDPEVLYFNWSNAVFWYEVKNKDMINTYIQATTGITLASSMPHGRG